MTNYKTITFENNKIIVLIDNKKIIWFNAKQVCISLKYQQPKKTINKNVDKSDKIQLKNMDISLEIKQQPDTIYINESGLYSLLISSRTEKAKKFLKWITNDVLPLVRQLNILPSDKKISKLLKKINELESQNKILKNDLKLEKYPEGAVVYITENHDTNGDIIYKLGKTDDLNKRIKIHNTHSIHNKKIVHYVEVNCPLQLETCIRSMLYKYRIKNRKDFFNCSLNKIKRAFTICIKSIKCIEQNGGSYNIITYYENKLIKLYKLINITSIE